MNVLANEHLSEGKSVHFYDDGKLLRVERRCKLVRKRSFNRQPNVPMAVQLLQLAMSEVQLSLSTVHSLCDALLPLRQRRLAPTVSACTR